MATPKELQGLLKDAIREIEAVKTKVEVIISRLEQDVRDRQEFRHMVSDQIAKNRGVLFGNGKDVGLVGRVKTLEDSEGRRVWSTRLVWSALTGLAGTVVAKILHDMMTVGR